MPHHVDDLVGDRIIAETQGNPPALVQLAPELTSDQLAGMSVLPQPLPIGRQLETRFLRQMRSLPADTQTFVLLAAAEPTGDAALVRPRVTSSDSTPTRARRPWRRNS